jgi:hypothetical protein
VKIYRAKMGHVIAYVEEHVAGKMKSQALLNPALDVVNHSPTGFGWGYAGSGAAQLALAILYDYYKDKNRAIRLHQGFKFAKVTPASRAADFVITEPEIKEWVADFELRNAIKAGANG